MKINNHNYVEPKCAYRCNRSRFSALVNDPGDKENYMRLPSTGTVRKALASLGEEPLYMGKFDHIVVHDDAPCSVAPEQKGKKARKEKVGIIVPKTSYPGHKRPEVTNTDFASMDKMFCWVCSILGITPTARQASKWRNRRGSAWFGQAQAARINRKRIAEKRLSTARTALHKAVIQEVCHMDDVTGLLNSAEAYTIALEKKVSELTTALNNI